MDQSSLAEMFLDQADWRDRKAVEYPDDKRNERAAALLRQLANSSASVPDDIMGAVEELHEDVTDLEVWNEMMKQVGFSSDPSSATQFLQDFIAARTG